MFLLVWWGQSACVACHTPHGSTRRRRVMPSPHQAPDTHCKQQTTNQPGAPRQIRHTTSEHDEPAGVDVDAVVASPCPPRFVVLCSAPFASSTPPDAPASATCAACDVNTSSSRAARSLEGRGWAARPHNTRATVRLAGWCEGLTLSRRCAPGGRSHRVAPGTQRTQHTQQQQQQHPRYVKHAATTQHTRRSKKGKQHSSRVCATLCRC